MVRIATITLVASTRRIPHAASIGGLGIYLWTCGNALQYSIFSTKDTIETAARDHRAKTTAP